MIGINIGDLCTTNPWKTDKIVKKLSKLKYEKVKFWHSDPIKISSILKDTGIKEVYLHMSNVEFVKHQNFEAWIIKNVYPIVDRFRDKKFCVVVGNEVLAPWNSDKYADKIVNALRSCYNALRKVGLSNVNVVTPLDLSCLACSYPPSSAKFITNDIIKNIVQFAVDTHSVLCFNIYPFFARSHVQENFALFEENTGYIDRGNKYTNLFDAQYDSIVWAIQKLGVRGSDKIALVCTETGWPSGGAPGATPENMSKYVKGVSKVAENGTPLRPGPKDIFLFELYDENLKDGPEYEKYFGLFKECGQTKF